jgi:hypothetical protein
MLMCKEATRLISDGLDRRLPFRQRMSLRLHVMMCGACTAYKRQVEAIHRLLHDRFAAPRRAHELEPTDSLRMSPDKTEKLKRLLVQVSGDDLA